jgi:predicted RNA-binding Zn ribbon-like protein
MQPDLACRVLEDSTEILYNVYCYAVPIRPTVEDMQQAGFPAGGEPLTALDLADTLVTVSDPPTDLLADADSQLRWWALQAPRLPGSPVPSPAATRQLRAAIRDLFDAHLAGRAAVAATIDDLNAAAASVPTSPRLTVNGDQPTVQPRWHTEHGGNASLAFIAREAIELIADPRRRQQLRRCANPACSMLFLATNDRRIWCTANICGNRTRVARHHHRSTAAPPEQ